VLFGVAQGVHGPEQATFFLSQFRVLGGEVDAFFKTNAGLLDRLKYSHALLHKNGFQKHLGRVLHMEQNARGAAVVIAGIER
jgi:hypothetical protein